MSNLLEVKPLDVSDADRANDASIRFQESATKLIIRDQQTYEIGGIELKKIIQAEKTIDEERKKITKPLNDVRNAVINLFKGPLERIAEAKKRIKQGMGNYETEQEQIRAEQQRKLRVAAEAEEARKRKTKEEQERKWRAVEEAKKKEADKLAAEGKEEEARKAGEEAEKAAEKAAERAQEASEVHVPAPIVAATIEKVKGTRQNWTFEIVNESLIPREHMKINEQSIRGVVKAMKGNTKIAGIRAYAETV